MCHRRVLITLESDWSEAFTKIEYDCFPITVSLIIVSAARFVIAFIITAHSCKLRLILKNKTKKNVKSLIARRRCLLNVYGVDGAHFAYRDIVILGHIWAPWFQLWEIVMLQP